MDDWQGCLAPQCQAALLHARKSVDRRGGVAITVEDFLLALLDSSPFVSSFLRGAGVDMDELIRTIQCEQPIVTEVGAEGLLSSQLIYWLATAREAFDAPVWLDWPQLLQVLARHAERLQEKAYVAVLELVSRWPEPNESEDGHGTEPQSALECEPAPVVVTDPEWVALADDVAVTLAAAPCPLVWVRGARGTGKSAWLRFMLSSLAQPSVQMDLRREADSMASKGADTPVSRGDREDRRPVLVLDNAAPADCLALMARTPGRELALVQNWQGPVLLLGPDATQPGDESRTLERLLGRSLEVFDMPRASQVQRNAVLVAHQAAIERRWNIQLAPCAIRFATSGHKSWVQTPGGMLQWVEQAAARLALFARRGPANFVALSGQVDTLKRQSLVAMARQEPPDDIEWALEEARVLRTALEVAWHERNAAGLLHTLTVDDLRRELECRARRVHYVPQSDDQQGDFAGAGPGNLYSRP